MATRSQAPASPLPGGRPPGGARKSARTAAPRKRPRAGKRELLLTVAQQLFAVGFERTTMDAVALAATVSKTTLYAYFPGKAELFTAVCEDKAAGLRASFESIGARTELTIEQRLALIGEQCLRLLVARENLALFRVLIAESAAFPTLCQRVVNATRLPTLATMSALIERAVAAGELVCDNCGEAAEFFLAMVQGAHHVRSLLDPHARPDLKHIRNHVKLCVRAFIGVYRPAAAAGPLPPRRAVTPAQKRAQQ